MKQVVLAHAAARDFDRLSIEIKLSFERAISLYVLDGRGDVKELTGRDGYRMRVGDYRMIFDMDERSILALYFGRRTTTTYQLL